MKRAIVPICVVVVLTFLSCFLIANEYNKTQKRKAVEKAATEQELPEEDTEEIVGSEELTTQLIGTLVIVNETGKTMTFQDIAGEKRYLFEYDETTLYKNKYDDVITLKQLVIGEVYEVNYSIHTRKINFVKVSSDIWTVTDVKRFSVDEKKKAFTLANDDVYQFTSDVVLISNNEEIEWMDITNIDTLTVKGYNRKICSIMVQEGHGYIRLKNDAYFIGGWIEVGQELIKPITEEMLLPVPEGLYTVRLKNRGYAGEVKVKIIRDKETLIDLQEIEIEEVAVGHVEFNITPEYALLYIDGEMSEYEDRIPLEYGVHQIKVEAAGYETISTNISVNSEYADISISLDEKPDENSDSEDSSSSSSNIPVISNSSSTSSFVNGQPMNFTNDTPVNSNSSTSSTSVASDDDTSSNNVISSTRKIYVEQPEGAEVYLDGAYIGIAPASTAKVTGSHVITLSKSGYETKSYTVNIENDGNDITLSFSDLTSQ